MLKVGLTGGIGSGKTIVGKVFRLLNIPVFNADNQAKALYQEDYLRSEIRKRFGNDLYKNNSLDKQKLASIIFQDKEALNELNQLVHPLVWKKFNHWTGDFRHLPYVIHEAAILLESGGKEEMDHVIYVYAPEQMRLKRIIDRDGLSEEEIKRRIKNQMDEQQKEQLSDYKIVNDNSQMIIPQVIGIHDDLINISKKLN